MRKLSEEGRLHILNYPTCELKEIIKIKRLELSMMMTTIKHIDTQLKRLFVTKREQKKYAMLQCSLKV